MFYTPILPKVEILGSSYELQLNRYVLHSYSSGRKDPGPSYELQLNRYNLPQAMNYPPGINVLAQVRPLLLLICQQAVYSS